MGEGLPCGVNLTTPQSKGFGREPSARAQAEGSAERWGSCCILDFIYTRYTSIIRPSRQIRNLTEETSLELRGFGPGDYSGIRELLNCPNEE